jgi:signal transduction histidine kinase
VIGFALVVAAATLAAGLAAGVAVRRLPTLRLQLAGLALVAVLLPLAAVLASGLVMFDSEHDLTILAVAAGAATAAGAAALALARAIGRDVEPLRRAAAALAGGDLGARAPEPATRELAALARDFNEMADKIEALFDARVQLVAWASHDLRTPLANVQAMLEAIEDGLARPEEYLPALRDQARVLGLLVDDLFELARIDAGVLTLELRDAELEQLVRGCLDGLAAEAQARGVRLDADVADGLTVRCAPEKVERVLFNLLTNALRHTPSDGSVAVRARPGEDVVEVTVEDSGEGLAPAASRHPAHAGGAGLGLSIARGLVEAHGGRIWAEDRPEGGARVSFTLPAV